ncbi:MAG TPA: sensor histidine kinase [Terriglobia bacterium]|nr:sensor histidine kinase [Terriglobia bacterium]
MLKSRKVAAGLLDSPQVSEARRVEGVLAAWRLIVGLGSIAVVCLRPESYRPYANVATGLILAYAVFAALVLLSIRSQPDISAKFRVVLHTGDVLGAASLMLFAGGPIALFLVFYLFASLAAAYRWGFKATFATAVSLVVLVWLEAVGLKVAPRLVDLTVARRFRSDAASWCIGILSGGCLLGYWIARKNDHRSRRSVIGHLVREATREASIKATLSEFLCAILNLFGAGGVALVVRESSTSKVFLYQAGLAGTGKVEFSELPLTGRNTYLFPVPANAWCVTRRRPAAEWPLRFRALSQEGHLRSTSCSIPAEFVARNGLRSALCVSFEYRPDWSGRIFVFNASGGQREDLRLLQDLVGEVGPSIRSIYELRRLRLRARRLDRTQLAHELHDGIVQSLVAVEMELEVLRHLAAATPDQIADEMNRAQHILHEEIVSVRELMQQVKPVELPPGQLVACLAEIVDRFRRETGIATSLSCDGRATALPPAVGREIIRIVQEALVNVRKHSRASYATVNLTRQGDGWRLSIEDNGRGFEFSGRLTQAELDLLGKGPRVIQERVRALGGEVEIESVPGRGGRLEISLPQWVVS